MPDVQVVQRASRAPAKKPERVSRAKKIIDAGGSLPLPDVCAGHLRDALFDVGPVKAGGMGPAPLDSTDLLAWQAERGIELQPWEAQLLRRLSRDYLAESQRAEDPNRLAPWQPDQPDEVAAQSNASAMQMKSAIRALAGL